MKRESKLLHIVKNTYLPCNSAAIHCDTNAKNHYYSN